jgi:hypothetical protein
MKNTAESLLGSIGILIAGYWTIPLIGYMSGVEIDGSAGLKMSIMFFIARFVWLYLLRRIFSGR